MKEYAKQFYYSHAWQKLSKIYLQHQNYVCERCGAPASVCHHKKYINHRNINNPEITLNFDNLEALCIDCHNREHFGRHSRVMFDDNGNISEVKESAAIENYKKLIQDFENARHGVQE